MTKIIVAGGAGRMGRRILSLGLKNKKIEIGGAFELPSSSLIGSDVGDLIGAGALNVKLSDAYESICKDGDVLIDFTVPQATLANLEVAVKNNCKIVIGTTGFTADEETKINKAAESIPVVFAPNMSVGMNVLFNVVEQVASILNDDYDIEIVEAHHKFKKDSPSGTALGLAKAAARGRNVTLDDVVVYGREGMCGERPKGEIGVHAVRGGDVVGDHTVSFMTEGERVEIGHRASSRDAFAKGALVAALFLSDKNKGLFSMKDVLGLN